MKQLLQYLRDYKRESILGPLFKLLEASFELFVPLVMAQIIDVGIKNRDLPYILGRGGVLVALGVIGMVCAITAQYFAAKAAVGCGTGLRRDLFAHLQGLSYADLDTLGTSTMITRMTSDINQVQNGVNMALRLFLRSPFIVFGAMVMAFTINVPAALVFVVAIPLLSLVVFGVMAATIPLYRRVQERLDRVLQLARENLTGVRVIRAFGQEERELADFTGANDRLVKAQLFVGKISAIMNPVTCVIINCAILALIWTGGWQVEGGVITQGEVVALINYMSQILVELVKLANLIILVTKSVACANRIQSVFEIKSSILPGKETPEGAAPEAVVFRDLSFAYRGAKADSLSGLSFTALRGQTIGVIGGTGSGKSSLVNLIPRFYDATGGTVLVDGVDVRQWDPEALRGRIGVVPQRAALFHGTIGENLRWGREEATDQELWQALETACAADFVRGDRAGLDRMILQGGKNLSGGQRQRLTIARALVRRPKILILDDSASALDYATDAQLRQNIAALDPEMTVFIVSQRAASIWNADQIIVLDDGRMAGIGTHRQLLDSCQVYQEIYYSQFPKEEEKSHG